MEFFLPADVFAAYPGPSRRRTSAYGAYPSANAFNGCGFAHPLFADSVAHAIQRERAAQAAARARAQAQRSAAARRAAEEQRQVQAYLQHILEMQREAERRYHLDQLRRQQQEAQRRQQYEEYQRRKAYAIAKERQRIAAQKAAEEQGRQLFLALEDLLFGGLNKFYCSTQHDDDGEDEDVELTHKNDDDNKHTSAAIADSTHAHAHINDIKGKAKATEEEIKESMDVDNAEHEDTAAAADHMATDEDPAEVGPAPSSDEALTANAPSTQDSAQSPALATETEQLVFSHSFPSDSGFDKTSIRADQINVSVDEVKRTVTVSGLWNNEPAPSTPARAAGPTPSDSSSRRGRSRSPKRARVSDVDENGEEIDSADANDDDFVEISFTPAGAGKEDKVSKTFDLPAGANIEDLRAELSEEGLKLFTTVSA